MKATMMDCPLTLGPLLDRAGKLFGNVEIVSCIPDRTLRRTTYADLHRRALALAGALQDAGLQPGDRVATLMWNHEVQLVASLGVPVAGGVFHPLNFRLHPNELAFLVNHAADRFLIVDDTLLPLFEKFRDQVRFERVFAASLSETPAETPFEDFESFVEGVRGNFVPPILEENAPAALCSTSGTTAQPKSVAYSHRALVFRALLLSLPDAFRISQMDTMLLVVPMFHLVGWTLPYVAVLNGSKIVLPGPQLDPESLLELICREEVTFSPGVPTVWQAIIEAIDRDPERWQGARGLRGIVGGAAPSETMLQDFDRHGLDVVHGWAMTETFPGTLSQPKPHMKDWTEQQLLELRAKQGTPGPFFELRAVGDAGVVPWDGESMGELQVKSPGTASSYHEMPEAGDRWTEDGWFRTGDVVTIDAEGYIKIVDRTKDLVKSGGEWISSVDLENALMGHPAVLEAAVVGVPHPKWSERPIAAVVLREGAGARPDELRAFLSSRFAKWQLPDAFVFVDAIPHTSTGKFSKTRLREQFADWNWDDKPKS